MRKLLYFAVTAAAALLVTSCSKDQAPDAVDDHTYVSFTLETESRIATRAVGDASLTNKVACAIFDADGNELTDLRKVVDVTTDATTGKRVAQYEAVRLAKGVDYRAVFFAYQSATGSDNPQFYNIADMTNIQILQNQLSNVEGRDAFTAYVDISAEQTQTENLAIDVTLYRPFAQLNIGSSADDTTAAAAAGIVVEQTQVTVTDVYTAFNAYANQTSGSPTTITFTMNYNNNLGTLTLADGQSSYNYLAMNYLLVGDMGDEKSLTNVTFNWLSEDGSTNSSATTFENIPVQRNYRTNIVGYILTNPADINIDIDSNFYGEYEIEDGTETVYNASIDGVMYETLAEALTAASDGDVVTVGSGNIDLPANLNTAAGQPAKSITIKGLGQDQTTLMGDTNSNANAPGNYAYNMDLVFEDLTYETSNNGYNGGFGHASSVTFRNCAIIGQYYAQSGAPHYFYNCTIDPLTGYLYTYASDCLFENCTFNSSEGKALQVYEDGTSGNNIVTINNCTFTAAKVAYTYPGTPPAGKPVTAVDINSIGATFNVTITNSTATGYGTGEYSGSKLWNIKGGENNVTLTIDGIVIGNGTYEISDAAGMLWFANEVNVQNNSFSGKTVKITADIDLAGIEWNPVGQTGATQFRGTFDGQGNTISNLKVNSSSGGYFSSGLFGWLNGATVQNLNIDNADIDGYHNCGVIAGYMETSGCTIDNCHVTNSEVYCYEPDTTTDDPNGDKAGIIVGFAGNSGTLVNDCTATDCSISAGRDAGQIAGAALTANITNCSATNVTVTANGTSTGANIRNEIIGRVL